MDVLRVSSKVSDTVTGWRAKTWECGRLIITTTFICTPLLPWRRVHLGFVYLDCRCICAHVRSLRLQKSSGRSTFLLWTHFKCVYTSLYFSQVFSEDNASECRALRWTQDSLRRQIKHIRQCFRPDFDYEKRQKRDCAWMLIGWEDSAVVSHTETMGHGTRENGWEPHKNTKYNSL